MLRRWVLGLAATATMLGITGCTTDEPVPAPTSPSPSAAAGSSPTAHQPSPSAVTRPTPTPLRPTPSASPAKTARDFVTAWLTTDPQARKSQLADTAVPHLAELLTQTDPAEIPDVQISGTPHEVALPDSQRPEHAADALRFRVDLTDGSAVLVDLIPDGSHGWLAAAIRPAD